MKKDGAEFEDEEYCTPNAGPLSVEHQALHLPRVRGCFGCDHGKALHQNKRRSKGATLGLTGPDEALKPFGALVHIDWLEMNGSKAHGIAARALLITDQETEFLGVLPSKRKLASEVVRALHDFDDPGSPAIRRLLSDRAPEFLSAGRTLRSSRPFAHFVTVPYRYVSKGQTERQWNPPELRCSKRSSQAPGGQYVWSTSWPCGTGTCEVETGLLPTSAGTAKTPYRMYPWGSLVFAHLHKPVVEDEEESDRWRSELAPCILVEVTMGPAGVWERCYGVVPLFRFTGLNRPSVVHVRRSIDIVFPEIVSDPLRQRLMVHGAVADRTLPVPGVATEEDGSALAEEREDIQDEVDFADGAWNENAAVFEQKDTLDTVLALDADDAVPDDEVVKEAEAAAVEGEAVDFPEVDADRKDEATLRDAVAEEVLAPAGGAPPTGWRVDRFPQDPARMRLVSTPSWSLRPRTCEPELWLIIGKPAQREMRAKWEAERSRGWG